MNALGNASKIAKSLQTACSSVVRRRNKVLIDVTLISGRRPDLLERTLASFQENLFRNFTVGQFIANIDPFAGDESDHRRCRNIIRGQFPAATLIEPQQASFGMAVKNTWTRSLADVVFHLEDDWILNEAVHSEDVLARLTEGAAAIQLLSKELQWDGTPFKQSVMRKRFLGIAVGEAVINVFGTSPGFWIGDVLRQAGRLMNPDLDPEKQMRPRINPPLFKMLNHHRCAVMSSKAGGELIVDIGREWRESRRITKNVVGGKSIWETQG
jgi:hypothetical protein